VHTTGLKTKVVKLVFFSKNQTNQVNIFCLYLCYIFLLLVDFPT